MGLVIPNMPPPLAHPYIRLMRLDKPAGILLLMWPCWWSVTLAWQAGGRPGLPWRFLLLFALGSLLMRSAGCIINDLTDRRLDAQVERTASRPLASGEMTARQAAGLLAVLLAAAFAVACLLGEKIVLLSLVWMLPVALYPWMKRFTWWPQLFLGLTFNGALFGWLAVAETLSPPAFWLYGAALFWALGYDTIYAHQDKADDARIGVRSTALRLGSSSKRWIAGFYAVALGCVIVAFQAAGGLGTLRVFLLGATAAWLGWQVWRVDLDDRAGCWRAFQSNLLIGGLIFVAALCR